MDVSKLNWLYYVGCLTSKYKKEYDKQDWTKWINYNLKFDYMWGSNTITCKEDVYDFLQEWLFYILKVWAFTSKNIDFSKIVVVQKNSEIYEVLDNWILEITNNNND